MNPNPDADTRSPWYEAYATTADQPEPRWLAGTRFPAPAEAEAAMGGGAEEQWATEALFDCYNG